MIKVNRAAITTAVKVKGAGCVRYRHKAFEILALVRFTGYACVQGKAALSTDFTVLPDRLIKKVLIRRCTIVSARLITCGLVAIKQRSNRTLW